MLDWFQSETCSFAPWRDCAVFGVQSAAELNWTCLPDTTESKLSASHGFTAVKAVKSVKARGRGGHSVSVTLITHLTALTVNHGQRNTWTCCPDVTLCFLKSCFQPGDELLQWLSQLFLSMGPFFFNYYKTNPSDQEKDHQRRAETNRCGYWLHLTVMLSVSCIISG